MRLVITTLAEYQTRFWLRVGLELRQRGHEALFVSFDSRSNELLRDAGLAYADATRDAQAAALGRDDPLEVCRRFGIDEPVTWLTHEKFAFGLRDSDALVRKLAGTLLLVDRELSGILREGPAVMVQELGGFLSVLGSHFAALSRGLPSWFIEPSFFRGRLLFNEGSLAAMRLPDGAAAEPDAAMLRYLDDTLASNSIVIPEKDRHQYTTAFRKVVNLRNARRLAEKARDKYLLNKQQEFGHIGSHVATHARMILASRKLSRHYTPLAEAGRFLYYPLHVPGDVALTLRSPAFLDQTALIDFLCRSTPLHLSVAVKEHPAMIGAMGSQALLELKRRYDRFVILPPHTNNYDVLRRAEAVVTVNSKSGAEAGLLGRRVLVLGDAFYRNAPFAHGVERLSDLPALLHAEADRAGPQASSESVHGYFAALWRQTHPGELYVEEDANVAGFTGSMLSAVAGQPDEPAMAAGSAATLRA